jgi:hypothetical protein
VLDAWVAAGGQTGAGLEVAGGGLAQMPPLALEHQPD